MTVETMPAKIDSSNGQFTRSDQERAAELAKLDIDFIPNTEFEVCDVDFVPLGAVIPGSESASSAPSMLPAHLERICETKLLTADDEMALFRQMNYLKFLACEFRARVNLEDPDLKLLDSIERLLTQAREIRDHIIRANMRLVMSIAKKFVTPCQTFDELLSEGTVTLMQAVEKFDFDRGFRFSTYAYRSISRTAYRFVAVAREEEARVTRDAEEWAFGQSDEQASSSMSEHLWYGLRELTSKLLHRLDRRERFIIRSRFALGSHHRVRTLQDLSNKLGISKERVRQIESKAVGKLQSMAKECDLDSIRFSAN